MHDPSLPLDTVTVELWRADAIVLLDWLQHLDEATLVVRHRAETQALRDLFGRLEVALVWPTDEEIERARTDVSAGMD